MGFWNSFRRGAAPEAAARPAEPSPRTEPTMSALSAGGARAELPAGMTFTGLDDPALLEYIRRGQGGLEDARAKRLRNMAVLRCVTLISGAIGRLPLNLQYAGTERLVAREHPAYRLLKLKPNNWQTPNEFKRLLQTHTMVDGEGFARVIWSGSRPIRLIPFKRGSVKPRQTDSWDMVYDLSLIHI